MKHQERQSSTQWEIEIGRRCKVVAVQLLVLGAAWLGDVRAGARSSASLQPRESPSVACALRRNAQLADPKIEARA